MNDKTKEKNKRKISIITVFLWIFLVVTMVVIVNDSIKNANALEENSGITMKLSMYDKTDTTVNMPVDEIVWNKMEVYSQDDKVILFKIDIDGYAERDYEVGELSVELLSDDNSFNPWWKNQIDGSELNPIWEINNSYEIKNKCKIKKGQKIFGTLQFATINYIIYSDFTTEIEAVMYNNGSVISSSNKCKLSCSERELRMEDINTLNSIEIYSETLKKIIDYEYPQNSQDIEFMELLNGKEIKWTPKIDYQRDTTKDYSYVGEDIEIGNDFIYFTNELGYARELKEDEYNFTKVKISSSMSDKKYSIYIKNRGEEDYKLYKNSTEILSQNIEFENEDIIGVKILIEDLEEIHINDLEIFANIHISYDNYNTLTLTSLLDIGYIRIYDDFESGITIKDDYIDLPIFYNYIYDIYGYNKKLNSKLEEYDKLNFGEKLDRKQVNSYSIENTGIELNYNGNNIYSRNDGIEINSKTNIFDGIEYKFNIDNKMFIDFNSEKIKKDMKLKIYNVIPNVVLVASKGKENIIDEIKSSMIIENENGINSDILNEIAKNAEVNITKDYNGKDETKIEIILDFKPLQNVDNNAGVTNISFDYSAITNIELVHKYGTMFNIKIYTMWEQQDLYSYGYRYIKFRQMSVTDGFKSLNEDLEDIDNDGDRDELVISYNQILWVNTVKKMSIQKLWKDNDNAKGLRPNDITAQLKANNEVISEYELSEKNNWSSYFLSEIFDRNNEIVNYSVEEKDDLTKLGYIKNISGNDSFIITNERMDLVKIEIPVEKVWEDEDNKAGRRDEIVTIQLKDGDNIIEEASLTEKNNWKYTFTNLPKYREDGSIIEYSIDEKETNEFYEKTIDGYKIINKYIGRAEDGIANDEKNVENGVDTSDINIWLYVVIAVISIVLIVVVIILLRRKNK